MTAIPIFILGRHRSGTTWLSNILASLPEVYAPTDAVHGGVHESGFFSHLVPHCGHGRTVADLHAIGRHFESSDFFALSGVDGAPDIVSEGPVGYFRGFMEAGARLAGARFWLEKTPAHTLHARFLRRAFGDAVFLAMIRDYREVVASNVYAFGVPASPKDWFWHSVVTAVYEKVIARNGIEVIRYESLVRDYPGTMHKILERLGIRDRTLPQSGFDPNSSYRSERPTIRWWQSAAMRAGRWLVAPLPGALVEVAVSRRLGRSHVALPPWFPARPERAPRRPGADVRA